MLRENEPPVADSGGSYNGSSEHSIQFSGSGSWDPDGWVTDYFWDFRDGTTGSGATPNHAYSSAGTYTVTLTVTDDGGATNSSQSTVTIEAVNGPQPVTIDFDELAAGTRVTNQYVPRVYFSATNFRAGAGGQYGSDLYADMFPPPFSLNKAIISDYNPLRGNPLYEHGTEDVYVSFAVPVNNLSFNVLNSSCCVAGLPSFYLDVFVNQNYYNTYYVSEARTGTWPITFLNTIESITDIHIYNPWNYKQVGSFAVWNPFYYDDFTFTPNMNVSITNPRVTGSLNGTTQYALLGADIILNSSITPGGRTGGTYSWSFTGPNSVVGGSINSSSVTIRSTDVGTITAKVTYTLKVSPRLSR